jgi:hypothetical protein
MIVKGKNYYLLSHSYDRTGKVNGRQNAWAARQASGDKRKNGQRRDADGMMQ